MTRALDEVLIGAQLAGGGGDVLLLIRRLLSLDNPGVLLLVSRTVGRAELLRHAVVGVLFARPPSLASISSAVRLSSCSCC